MIQGCPSERVAVVKLPGWLKCGEVREVEMERRRWPRAGRSEHADPIEYSAVSGRMVDRLPGP